MLVPNPPHVANNRTLREERYVTFLRWVSCPFVLLLIPVIQQEHLEASYAVVGAAMVNNAIVSWVLLPRGSKILKYGYFAFCVDIIALSTIIWGSGGINSPYYIIYYTIQLVYSLRFPGQGGLAIPFLVTICYGSAIFLAGG